MIEQEINCIICGKHMGHIIVKKEAQSDDEIRDSLKVFSKPSAVEIVCDTCWITNVENRDFYRIGRNEEDKTKE